MPQYVLEFGAEELAPVVDALISWMGQPDTIEIATNEPDAPKYEHTTENLPVVVDRLQRGTLVSVILRGGTPGLRYGLILSPHFNGQRLSKWMGTLESTASDWRPMWNTLLKSDRLSFVCLGSEEGVELSDDQLNVSMFPWNEWPMIIGALRDADGQWVIRENAAYVASH